MRLQQALAEGFKCSYLHRDIRLGLTLPMSKPINELPSLEEGFAAFREGRSIPLMQSVIVTLQDQHDLELLSEHCLELM